MKKLIKKVLKILGYKIISIDNFLHFSSLEIISSLFDKKSNFIIFDVGANLGQSAQRYRKIFPKAKIFSFEPLKESYEILKSKKIKNLKTFNIGFSDKKSSEEFSVNERSETNSLLSFSKNAKQIWGTDSLSNIKKTISSFDTVDNFCFQKKINFIDFLKIDVQGAEYLVLEGAKKTLLNKKIKVIQLEVIIGETYVGQKSLGFYISLLTSYGYKLKMFADVVIKYGEIIQLDLIFCLK